MIVSGHLSVSKLVKNCILDRDSDIPAVKDFVKNINNKHTAKDLSLRALFNLHVIRGF